MPNLILSPQPKISF